MPAGIYVRVAPYACYGAPRCLRPIRTVTRLSIRRAAVIRAFGTGQTKTSLVRGGQVGGHMDSGACVADPHERGLYRYQLLPPPRGRWFFVQRGYCAKALTRVQPKRTPPRRWR